MKEAIGRIRFPGHDGAQLEARLDRPAVVPHSYALFAHCFTCSKDIFAARRISQALTENGFAVLRFDFTGLGSSEGEFGNTDFSSNVADLICAADYLRTEYAAPALLIGHSLGGAAVLAAAGDIAEVRAVATIGAPSDPAHVKVNFAAAEDEIREHGSASVTLAGRRFRISRRFLEDIESQRLTERIADLNRALLVFHSPVDKVVGVDHARRIFEAARHPKSFVSLDNADHLLQRRADAEYVAGVLAAWASRYLDKAAGKETLPEGAVEVAETGSGRLTQRVRAGRHTLVADEPEAHGGDDTGPDPYAYLLASLGACTAMTLRLYAEHKGLALDSVRVRLSHGRIHAADCEGCETSKGKVDRIERELVLEGQLSAEERRRLVEIADKCPVHRTLVSETIVATRIAEEK